jgi:Bacteriophage HK97-gp10, putative tail-component
MAETIEITGLNELQKKLYSYSQQLGDKVVEKSLRQGAGLVKAAILKEIDATGLKVKTGRLRRGFTVKKSKIHSTRTDGIIGIFLSLKKGKDAPFYGRFLNDGWNTHGKLNAQRLQFGGHRNLVSYTRRAIGSSRTTAPGRTNVPGREFVPRGFEQSKNSALRLIVADAQAGAELLARKVGL